MSLRGTPAWRQGVLDSLTALGNTSASGPAIVGALLNGTIDPRGPETEQAEDVRRTSDATRVGEQATNVPDFRDLAEEWIAASEGWAPAVTGKQPHVDALLADEEALASLLRTMWSMGRGTNSATNEVPGGEVLRPSREEYSVVSDVRGADAGGARGEVRTNEAVGREPGSGDAAAHAAQRGGPGGGARVQPSRLAWMAGISPAPSREELAAIGYAPRPTSATARERCVWCDAGVETECPLHPITGNEDRASDAPPAPSLVARLRGELFQRAVRSEGYSMRCLLCLSSWSGGKEKHADGCLLGDALASLSTDYPTDVSGYLLTHANVANFRKRAEAGQTFDAGDMMLIVASHETLQARLGEKP